MIDFYGIIKYNEKNKKIRNFALRPKIINIIISPLFL